MRKPHIRLRAALVAGALAAAAGLVAASSASAVTLNGDWAPFTRCPVDNPQMLAVTDTVPTPGAEAICFDSNSPNGTFTIGKHTIRTGDNDLQFGLITDGFFTYQTVVNPATPLVAAPVEVPGGLLGLMCPSSNPIVAKICATVVNSPLNRVTASVEPAGAVSNFNLFAGLSPGQPILTLPIKIHLQNPFLGKSCYIGSNAHPIVLHPAALPGGSLSLNAEEFDGNGTPDPNGPMIGLIISGINEGDSSFAVPKASGCGLAGLLDGAINSKEQLPSPAGHNSVTLNDATTSLAGLLDWPNPQDGVLLSQYWHSAVLP